MGPKIENMLIVLGKVMLIAVAYALLGRAALFLAIPPGFSTVIWPSAGVALAAILLLGYRYWPGVVLGSFLINGWIMLDVNGDTASILKSLLLALSIGCGASLSAVIGAWLIRGFVGFPSGLTTPREVAMFLALGGPAACAIAATWGTGTLYLGNEIPGNALVQNWATWWVGDTIGVLLFAPLVLIWAGEPRDIWSRRRVSVALPLAITFGVSVVVFAFARAWEDERIHREFERRSQLLGNAMEKSFGDYTQSLYAMSGLFNASDEVTRDGFAKFAEFPLGHFKGISGLSWNPVVPHAARRAFEEAARSDGIAEFQVTEKDAAGATVRSPDREEYTAVLYIAPQETHRGVLGFNVASEPMRARAMAAARDTGNPVATARLRLLQDDREVPGLLIFMPIYAKDRPLTSVEHRREAIEGYVVGVFRIAEAVEATLEGLDRTGVIVSVNDETDAAGEELLKLEENGEAGAASLAFNPRDYEVSREYDMAGRKWVMRFAPTLKYLASQQSWHSWAVLAGGLLFTSLLGGFLLVVSGRGAVDALRGEELSRLNEGLEREIAERRAAEGVLREKTAELERYHNITMGREVRVIELKREVNELSAELGKPLRYSSVHRTTAFTDRSKNFDTGVFERPNPSLEPKKHPKKHAN